MGFRFRKSFRLAPGLRMNLSGSGLGFSVGPRGATVSFGKRGAYMNAGIPGTGISMREKIGGGRSARKASASPAEEVSIRVGVSDDGTVSFNDQYGRPLPDKYVAIAKRQHGESIRNLIQKKCDEINAQIDSVGEIHLCTPSPRERPSYVARAFDVPEPVKPQEKRLGFFWSLFRSRREKVDAENRDALAKYQQCLAAWESERAQFFAVEEKRKALIDVGIYSDVNDMELFLEDSLKEIAWPRETVVSTEVLEVGRVVFIDVDFPELEDMPANKAAVPAKGYRLSVKEMSPTNIQKLYMKHIHGIAFRIVGEVFHALPRSEIVVFSGFSQRASKATGQISDEYLISVRVGRGAWEEIDFNALEVIDVTVALEQYELRRSMTKTGIFKPIDPFTLLESAGVGSQPSA